MLWTSASSRLFSASIIAMDGVGMGMYLPHLEGLSRVKFDNRAERTADCPIVQFFKIHGAGEPFIDPPKRREPEEPPRRSIGLPIYRDRQRHPHNPPPCQPFTRQRSPVFMGFGRR